MKKNLGLKEFTHLVPCKRNPKQLCNENKKKAQKWKVLKKVLQVVPYTKKMLKKSFKKVPQVCPQKKKCQKKNSNFISPFIIIINP
jgi:hypothetical protein